MSKDLSFSDQVDRAYSRTSRLLTRYPNIFSIKCDFSEGFKGVNGTHSLIINGVVFPFQEIEYCAWSTKEDIERDLYRKPRLVSFLMAAQLKVEDLEAVAFSICVSHKFMSAFHYNKSV